MEKFLFKIKYLAKSAKFRHRVGKKSGSALNLIHLIPENNYSRIRTLSGT